VWTAGSAGEAIVVLTSIVRVGSVASALLLAGCGSWAPSWDLMPSMPSLSGGASVSLTIESDPPGADAKTSLGASCRTPCMIPVAADREFTVSYALNGYQPQVISVTPRMPETTRLEPEVGGAAPLPELSPKVAAQLETLFIAPGNPGTAQVAENREVKADDRRHEPAQTIRRGACRRWD